MKPTDKTSIRVSLLIMAAAVLIAVAVVGCAAPCTYPNMRGLPGQVECSQPAPRNYCSIHA